MFNYDKIPTEGYLLKNWNQSGYRATAIAYLEREGLDSVQHRNGNWYTLQQLRDAIINNYYYEQI